MQHLEATHTITQKHIGLSAETPVLCQNMEFGGEGEVPPHDHDYYEICLFHEGSASHRTTYYTQPVQQGSVIVVPPGPVHGFENTHGMRITNIYYLAEWLLDDLRILRSEAGLVPLFLSAALFGPSRDNIIPQFQLGTSVLVAIVQEIQALQDAGNEQKPSLLLLKSILQKIMVYLCRAYTESDPRSAEPPFRKEVWWLLDRIERTIFQGIPFQVQEAARESGYSPDGLSRIFKEATGRNLVDYYQHRRIQHAQRLLLDPRQTVTEVAYQIGYSDTAHLCKQFKQILNMTPGQYRRQYIHDNTAL